MENKNRNTEKQIKNNTPDTARNGSISQNAIRKGLTIAVTIFAVLLIICVALIFVVSKKIESLAGADAQIKLSAQGGFSCEYSEAQKLYPLSVYRSGLHLRRQCLGLGYLLVGLRFSESS